jgi:hypothetical protein
VLTSGQAATIGLSLQITGGVIAVVGLLSTWWAYSASPPFPALWRRVAALTASIRSRLNVHRQPERSAAETFNASDTANALIEWGPLPEDHDAALGNLDRRTREFNRGIAHAEDEAREGIDRVRKDLGLGLERRRRSVPRRYDASPLGASRSP